MNFIDFVEKMIELCQNNIIYDGYFLDTLIIWLIGFTDSQIRAFRHTCTLACKYNHISSNHHYCIIVKVVK